MPAHFLSSLSWWPDGLICRLATHSFFAQKPISRSILHAEIEEFDLFIANFYVTVAVTIAVLRRSTVDHSRWGDGHRRRDSRRNTRRDRRSREGRHARYSRDRGSSR